MAALKRGGRARGAWRWLCAGAAVWLMPGLASQVRAAADQREVQAVFLLNLTRFVHWPDSAFASDEAPFVMGLLPDDPVRPALEEAAKGEFAGKREIVLREVRTTADLDGCHLVHVAKNDMTQAALFLAQVREKPVLTVSDAEGFLRLGGHVQLFRRGGQFKLRLDLENLRRAELSASAPLLRVAEVAEK